MEFDHDNWILHYQKIKTDYQAKRKYSQIIPNNEGKELLNRMNLLEKSLNVMKDSPMQYELSMSELARRQFLLESFRKQINTAMSASTTPNVLTPSANASPKSVEISTINPLAASDKALIQRQHEVIKMQDNILKDIEEGVDRLHDKAKDIGQEIKVQDKILDDLDVKVDEATEGLKEETKHAERIRIKSDTFYMYICIVIEIVVLIVLLLMAFGSL